MEKKVMQSRSKGASVMDGWMDMAYTLRHWFSLLNHPFLFFFFETWLPLSFFLFSSFFWVMLLWHAIFSLFGATII